MNEVERRGEIFGAVERVFGSHAAIEMLNEHDAAVRDAERNQLEDALRDARAERDALRARIEALHKPGEPGYIVSVQGDGQIETRPGSPCTECGHEHPCDTIRAALSPAEEQRP